MRKEILFSSLALVLVLSIVAFLLADFIEDYNTFIGIFIGIILGKGLMDYIKCKRRFDCNG